MKGAGLLPGQKGLEVGCGTGYFTVPDARLIGGEGSLVAMDVLSASVEAVERKVLAAGLKNVRVIQADAVDTGLDAAGFDTILLFGVIPAPMLPMSQLLHEMQRVLKPEG